MGRWLGDSTSTSTSIRCTVTIIDFYTTGFYTSDEMPIRNTTTTTALAGGKEGGIKIDR